MTLPAAWQLVVDVAEVVAAWLHLVVWTGLVMVLVALAGVAAAAIDGPAAGGLVVGALSVCVDLGLLLAARHIRPLSPSRLLMPVTHPRAVRRAAAAAFAVLLLLAVLAGCHGPGSATPPTTGTGATPTATTTAVQTAGVVIVG